MAASAGAAVLPPLGAGNATEFRSLTAAPAKARLGGDELGVTDVWSYDGTTPGPVLRVKQGAMVRVRFRNRLAQPSTIHWHGIRIANAMDGVPELTQPLVPPGGTFDYEFRVPDAGTFFYHPHHRSWEQMARGLYGALIVDEANPPAIDRELLLVIDDWRLQRDGKIHEASFGSMMDQSHAGRMGNWLTVNGRSRQDFPVTRGERLRIRLINTATARILSVRFDGHDPVVVALDGQPTAQHAARDSTVTLAPAQRADLVIEMTGEPGSRHAIHVTSGRASADMGALAYRPGILKRVAPLPPFALATNPLPGRLDLAGAVKADLIMEGGAMGRMDSAMFKGRRMGIRELIGHGMAWSLNGVAGRPDKPLLTAPRGQTVLVNMVNRTAWPHAMHLHGHHFRAVERNGRAVAGAPWRDTILLDRNDQVRVAFVADNPGKWLFHCHMVDHTAAGMATWVDVKT